MPSRISISSPRCVGPASSPAAATSGGPVQPGVGEGEVPAMSEAGDGSAQVRVRPTSRGCPAAAERVGAMLRATT